MMSLTRMPARFVFFMTALLLYAALGSPTPDDPGVIEIIIGGLLLLTAAYAAFFKTISKPQSLQMLLMLSLFLYGVFICSMQGALNAQDPSIIVRDAFAFFLMALPLFFTPLVAQNIKFFEKALLIIGVCFSLRALLPLYGFAEIPEELLYLANSPLVLLTALLCVAKITDDVLYGAIKPSTLFYAILIFIPLAAMMIDVQRAPMTALFITAAFAMLLITIKRPARGFAALIVLGIAALFFAAPIQDVLAEIWIKTSRVGLNMRAEELMAVIAAIDGSWHTAVFGLGWAGQFQAPTVGGLTISYTHSFLSYILLKGGIMGLGLALLLSIGLLWSILQKSMRYPLYGMALLWPFLIPLLLYASHKSFDFGLMLLFIFALCVNKQSLRSGSRMLKVGHASNPKGQAASL